MCDDVVLLFGVMWVKTHSVARLPMTEIFKVFSRAAHESEYVGCWDWDGVVWCGVVWCGVVNVSYRADIWCVESDGSLDRVTFERCFSELLSKDVSDSDSKSTERDEEIMSLIARRIFDVFDRDGNGTVDYSEFIAGISLLCRASSDDKIRAAFQLFDLDNGWFTRASTVRTIRLRSTSAPPPH